MAWLAFLAGFIAAICLVIYMFYLESISWDSRHWAVRLANWLGR